MKIAIINPGDVSVNIREELENLDNPDNILSIKKKIIENTKHLVKIIETDDIALSVAHGVNYKEGGIIDEVPHGNSTHQFQIFFYQNINSDNPVNNLASFFNYQEKIHGPAVIVAYSIESGKITDTDMTLDIWGDILSSKLYGSAVYLRCDGTTHQFYFYHIEQLLKKVFPYTPQPDQINALKYGLDIYSLGEKLNTHSSILAKGKVYGDSLIIHNMGENIIGHLSEKEVNKLIEYMKVNPEIQEEEMEMSRYQIMCHRNV
jgi:hypothetical protein